MYGWQDRCSFRGCFFYLTKFLSSCIISLLQNWKHPWIVLYSTCNKQLLMGKFIWAFSCPRYKISGMICLSYTWRQDLVWICDNLRFALQVKDSLYWDILNYLANWRNFRLKLNSKLWKLFEWTHLISLSPPYDVFLGTVGDHIHQAESWCY